MLAAVIVLGGVLAATVGLGIFLAVRWHKTNERAWDGSNHAHDLALRQTKLEGQYDQAMGVIDVIKRDNVALEKALKEAEDAYAELATETVDDVESPRTANVLRMALRRLDRLRPVLPEVPKAPEASATEGGEGEGAVHESDPESPSETG